MTISYTIPTAGSTLNSVADPQISTALQTLLTWANGNIDSTNVSAALAQAAAVNQSGQTVKGAVNIAASQATSSAAYTTLATPDQVTGIVLPSNGLIAVWYQATWQATASGLNSAAIFLGSNQLVAANADATAPSATLSACVYQAGANNTNKPLVSYPLGLTSLGIGDSNAYTGDLTTGQIVGSSGNSAFLGGPCYIFAAAGTYTISVQFKAASGSVTASNRKLWVQAVSFS